MVMCRCIFLIIGLMFFFYQLDGQDSGSGMESADGKNTIVMKAKAINGDTVPWVEMREIIIFPMPGFENKRDYRKFKRLVRDIKKVYPYAIIAGEILVEMNEEFVNLESEYQKKKFIKKVENRLRSEFEEELKSLTISQGRLLIKLVDRETGNTTYQLVKEMRGSFSAFFWQSLARLFGSDLRSRYDPFGEDRLIEKIIIQIENGQL